MIATLRGLNLAGVVFSVAGSPPPPPSPLVFTLTSPGTTFPGDDPFRVPDDSANYTGGSYTYTSLSVGLHYLAFDPNVYGPTVATDFVIGGITGLGNVKFGMGRADGGGTDLGTGLYINENSDIVTTDSNANETVIMPISLSQGDVITFEYGGWQYGNTYIYKNGVYVYDTSGIYRDLFIYKIS